MHGFPTDQIFSSFLTGPLLVLELNKPDKLRPELNDNNRPSTTEPVASSQQEGSADIFEDMYLSVDLPTQPIVGKYYVFISFKLSGVGMEHLPRQAQEVSR